MYICVQCRETTHSLRRNGSRREKSGGEVITCFYSSQRCVRNKCKFNVLRDECTSESQRQARDGRQRTGIRAAISGDFQIKQAQ